LLKVDENAVTEFGRKLTEAIRTGNTIFLCGNGGSAVNAVHIKNDLVKLVYDETGLPVNCVCLNDSVLLMTALSNDERYENVFSGQLEKMCASFGDVLLVLTGSGNSQNVLEAARVAGETYSMTTLALTGMGGGKVIDLVDQTIVVDSDCMQVIEDIHRAIGHMLVHEVIDNLNGEQP